MLQLVLSDGRELVAAGAHPAAWRHLPASTTARTAYDGAMIVSTSWVASTAPATFDILPAGRRAPTGPTAS
jgi:hypothetical protein